MTSATEELRQLLSEHNIKYETEDYNTIKYTFGEGSKYRYDDCNNDSPMLHISGCTPKQTVITTLGNKKLTADQVRECAEIVYLEGYNDGSVNRGAHINETDWQAIADRLNRTLGNDPYDAVSCEHVISPDTLHQILDEGDVHPGWTATNEIMANLFNQATKTFGDGKVNEDKIDKWLRKFQREHNELVYIGADELRDLAYALHDDIPLGYEASMRLGQWLLKVARMLDLSKELSYGEC